MDHPNSDEHARASQGRGSARPPPNISDHELLRCIGRGSYGDVWLARTVMGEYRAVKIVYRQSLAVSMQ